MLGPIQLLTVLKRQDRLFRPVVFQQFAAALNQQQMCRHLTWSAEQSYNAIAVAVLTVPFPLQIRTSNPLSTI